MGLDQTYVVAQENRADADFARSYGSLGQG
jgi:hypothetical protein